MTRAVRKRMMPLMGLFVLAAMCASFTVGLVSASAQANPEEPGCERVEIQGNVTTGSVTLDNGVVVTYTVNYDDEGEAVSVTFSTSPPTNIRVVLKAGNDPDVVFVGSSGTVTIEGDNAISHIDFCVIVQSSSAPPSSEAPPS
nr:hypothetical protein [Actinomycetota bacterium]